MRQLTDWEVSALILIGVTVGCQSYGKTTATTGDDTDGGDYTPIVILDAGSPTPVSPDGRNACEGSCNYQTQVGCDSGLMCSPIVNADQTVSAGCIAAGAIAVGQSCEWEQCQPGYICASDGHCRHMCCGGDWSVCADGESCIGKVELLPLGASDPVSAGVGVCSPLDDCDVFDTETCPAGQGCYIIDSRAGTKCLPSGTSDANESCTANVLCKPGLTCVNAGKGLGECRRLCRAVPGGGLPGCPEIESKLCSHFARDPPGVGECTPEAQP